jgi:hypothetical protein
MNNWDPFLKGYEGQTTIHIVGLTAVLLLGAVMLLVKRRNACIPMLLMACFIAPAQRVVVFTLDFNLLRIMVLFGFIRIVMRGEWRAFSWRTLDYCIAVWTIVGLIANVLLLRSVPGFVNRLGSSFDAVGMYFLFRMLIRTPADITTLVKAAVFTSFFVAIAFLVENRTGRNVFAFLGGVPEHTLVRNGRLRCQGAFAHPILAGCFWAALLPIVAAQYFRGARGKRLAIVGSALFCAIILLCASSTPVMGVIFAGIGAGFFYVRHRMQSIRWALFFMVIALHMVMNKPVWHLLGRVDILSGSTGYHRYALIDAAIKHYDEWVLYGTGVGTAHWGFGLVDVTNHFLVQGLQGGILQFVLFIVLVACAFRSVGRTWRAAANNKPAAILAWSLGVSLFVHCCNFIAVTYFGQINMVWYLTLALIQSMEPMRLRRRVAIQQAVTRPEPHPQAPPRPVVATNHPPVSVHAV